MLGNRSNFLNCEGVLLKTCSEICINTFEGTSSRITQPHSLNLSAVLRGEKKKTKRKIKPNGVNGKEQNRT